jgi:hypothetical protein
MGLTINSRSGISWPPSPQGGRGPSGPDHGRRHNHLLKVLHFIPIALRPAEHNRFGEALSVRYQTQRPRRAAAGDTSSLIRTLTITKRYAAGLEMSCPGGACYWVPEIPSVTLRPSRPDARADVNRFTIVVVFSSARPAVGTHARRLRKDGPDFTEVEPGPLS